MRRKQPQAQRATAEQQGVISCELFNVTMGHIGTYICVYSKDFKR